MTLLEAYLGPLAECFTPDVARRVVEFQPDARTAERLAILREKANEGTLLEAERAEYEAFVNAIDFIAILKTKAKSLLSARS